MAGNLALDFNESKVLKTNGDMFILLIDHDEAFVASLTSMLEKFSYKGKIYLMQVFLFCLSFL